MVVRCFGVKPITKVKDISTGGLHPNDEVHDPILVCVHHPSHELYASFSEGKYDVLSLSDNEAV